MPTFLEAKKHFQDELNALVGEHQEKLRRLVDRMSSCQISEGGWTPTDTMGQPSTGYIMTDLASDAAAEKADILAKRMPSADVHPELSVPRSVVDLLEERDKRRVDTRRGSDESEVNGAPTLTIVSQETSVVLAEEDGVHDFHRDRMRMQSRLSRLHHGMHPTKTNQSDMVKCSTSTATPGAFTTVKERVERVVTNQVSRMQTQMSHSRTNKGRLRTMAQEDARQLRTALRENKRTMERFLKDEHHALYQKTWRDRVEAILNQEWFEYMIFVIIASNVIVIGIEVDQSALYPTEFKSLNTTFRIIDFVYTAIFLSELMLRVAVFRLSFFFGENWAWNLFDAFVVISSLIDVVSEIIQITMHHKFNTDYVKIFRVIRVTRLLRSFRMVRMVRFIRALRTLVYSILVTLRSLVWALLLLVLVFYGFAIAFTQAVADQCGTSAYKAVGCDDPILEKYWGRVPRSMFTLFKAITNGVGWDDVVTPLGGIEPWWMYMTLFNVFICFTYFAVLNVITGVFCQSAMDSAQTDKEIATMQQIANKDLYINALKQLFMEIAMTNSSRLTSANEDQDESQYITLHNLERGLRDDRLQAYLAVLDIETTDAWTLFKLLDCDKTGQICYEEFIEGCLALKGNAKAIHIAKLSHENKMLTEILEEFMCCVDDQLQNVNKVLKKEAVLPRAKGNERGPQQTMHHHHTVHHHHDHHHDRRSSNGVVHFEEQPRERKTASL